jgi:hypothetical protein
MPVSHFNRGTMAGEFLRVEDHLEKVRRLIHSQMLPATADLKQVERYLQEAGDKLIECMNELSKP